MNTSKANFKVSFYIKRNASRDGLCPVMGRIAVDGETAQFSCRLEVNPSLWDARAGRANGKSAHARTVNGEIDRINVAVNARYAEILSLRGKATASEVRNAFQGVASAQETLLKVFREHNLEYERRTGVSAAKSTFDSYRVAYNYLERFIREKYHVSDISFRQLDCSFIENYGYYLRIDCRMAPNTVLQKVTYMKKMIKIAIGRGIIIRNPFAGYVPERPKAVQRFLPAEELKKLMAAELKAPLEVTRDLFVFSCFTGLAYADVCNLSAEHIIKMDDGSLWLHAARQKTGSVSRIPLLEIPLRIIEKYGGTTGGDRLFPVKSCCTLNKHLNRIAKHCGIERHMHFHMARHTFATETCLSQGVPIETVSRMMGHSELSTTQIYARVTRRKIDEDMKALSERISGKYTLVS